MLNNNNIKISNFKKYSMMTS